MRPPLTPPSPLAKVGGATWALRGIFAVVLIFAVREAKPLLAPVLIAIVLTFVLAPLVRLLRRRARVPEVAGAGLVVLALLASTVPVALSLAQPAARWWERAPTTVAQLLAEFDRLRAGIPGLGPPAAAPPASPPVRSGARGTASEPPASTTPPPDPVKERIASEGVALTGALLGQGVAFAVSAAATVILLYFLLASEHWMLSRSVEAMPRQRTRALLLGGVRAAQREIGRYLVALGLINATVGVITALALWGLGLPNPTLWGVVVAVLGFVPYIGPLIVTAMLLAAGLTTFHSWTSMLAPAGVYLALHAVESNVISPWFVGRRLLLSPISVFLSVMFWGWVWGIAGALIAVPLLIALRALCRRSRNMRLLCRFLEGDHRHGRPPSLRSLLKQPRQAGSFRLRRSPPPSEAVNVAQAGGVHVLPADAGKAELVARPLEHDA